MSAVVPDGAGAHGRPAVVFVHGAWHGSWCWDLVRAHLDRAGLSSVTVDLPSVVGGPGVPAAPGSRPLPSGMHGDAAVVRARVAALLQEADGPVVVVAHSYGAVPTSEALADLVGEVRLVVVTGFLLDVGESLLAVVGGARLPWWLPSPDGTSYTVQDPVGVFYADCDPALARTSAARLLPQSVASFTESLRAAAWHSTPTTYVIGEQDRAVPPEAQEAMAQRADAVHRLPSGHAPFFSAAEEVARIVLASVRAAA